MKPFNNEQPAIVATVVPEEARLEFLPRHFGTHMLTVENYVYAQFATLCPTYTGGYWHFSDVSHGGCYLAPSHVCSDLSRSGPHGSVMVVRKNGLHIWVGSGGS